MIKNDTLESGASLYLMLKKTLSALILCAGAAIGVFVFLNLSVFILPDSFLSGLTGANAVLINHAEKAPLSPDEKKALLLLVEKGRVLTQDQFLSMLSQFYNGTINTLIVVISLLGIIAYFSIKSLSLSHAEEIAEKQISKSLQYYLSDDDNVKDLLDRSALIQNLSYNEAERIKRTSDLEKKLNHIESFLFSISPQGTEEKSGKKLVEEASEDGNNKKK